MVHTVIARYLLPHSEALVFGALKQLLTFLHFPTAFKHTIAHFILLTLFDILKDFFFWMLEQIFNLGKLLLERDKGWTGFACH